VAPQNPVICLITGGNKLTNRQEPLGQTSVELVNNSSTCATKIQTVKESVPTSQFALLTVPSCVFFRRFGVHERPHRYLLTRPFAGWCVVYGHASQPRFPLSLANFHVDPTLRRDTVGALLCVKLNTSTFPLITIISNHHQQKSARVKWICC
jgi:hypothetical protein